MNFSVLSLRHASICWVLLLLQCASLLAWHRHPQTVFYNEWMAAGCLLLLGALLWRSGRVVLSPVAWGIGAFFAVLVAWTLVGRGMGTWPLAAYAALFGGMWWVTQLGCARLGRERWVSACAWGMALCACLQCAAGALQLAGLSYPGLLMGKVMNAAFGNVAQENHFANLLWLGLVSIFYLWLRSEFPTRAAVVAAAVLSVFAALSVSRSVWLYAMAVPVLAVIAMRQAAPSLRRRVLWGAGTLLALTILTQLWLAFGGAQNALGVTSAIGRAAEAGSNGQRWFDWVVAARTAWSAPVTGVGPGLFAWQTALANVGLASANYVRIGENAHNTLLHFAAEFGLLWSALMWGLFVWWLQRRWRAETTLESLWALGIIGVIGAHSLVEYPLWYAYFLLPLACAFGVIDAQENDETVSCRRLPCVLFPRWFLGVVLCGGVALWVQSWRDYRGLEAAYRVLNAQPSSQLSTAEFAQLHAAGKKVAHWSLLAPQAVWLSVAAWQRSLVGTQQVLQAGLPDAQQVAYWCDGWLRYRPQFTTLQACVAAYGLTGQRAKADQINHIVAGAFAPVHSQWFFNFAQTFYTQQGWGEMLLRP